MGGAPVQFYDAALRLAFEPNPIIHSIGPAEAQHKPREHIAQRALECQADDDCDGAGSREQALHRQVKDIGYDGEDGDEVDETREEVL
jgi:hypothetical protein